jgi:hypothetical protein
MVTADVVVAVWNIVAPEETRVVREEGSSDRVVLGVDVRDVEKRRLIGTAEGASIDRVGMGSLARQ